jgi:hypothetical protein
MMEKLQAKNQKCGGAVLSVLVRCVTNMQVAGRRLARYCIFTQKTEYISLSYCDINLFSKELDTLGKYKTGVGCLYIKKL